MIAAVTPITPMPATSATLPASAIQC